MTTLSYFNSEDICMTKAFLDIYCGTSRKIHPHTKPLDLEETLILLKGPAEDKHSHHGEVRKWWKKLNAKKCPLTHCLRKLTHTV